MFNKLRKIIIVTAVLAMIFGIFPQSFSNVAAASLEVNYVISTLAGNGNNNYSGDGGLAIRAELNYPSGVAVDSTGNVYIADTWNNRIRKVTTNGIISTIAGTGVYAYSGDRGLATKAQLSCPEGVAVDSEGNVYIADSLNNRIREVTTDGVISTIAGAVYGQLNAPTGVTLDGAGNIYIADSLNNQIQKITTDGAISTIAGNRNKGYYGDGHPAIYAKLNDPAKVAVDSAGNIYIADTDNHRIRKVATDGIISTIAGAGTTDGAISPITGTVKKGDSGDGRPAVYAQLTFPQGIAVDSTGNVYIADSNNNRIREVTTDGIISTIAGNGLCGYSGDGGLATSARLNGPEGIALDSAGNIYISEMGNNCIRKLQQYTITRAAAIPDITAANGTMLDAVPLPQTVNVTLNDSTTKSVAVTWDGGNPAYNGNIPGTYTFTGTITPPAGAGNLYNIKASVKVVVAAPYNGGGSDDDDSPVPPQPAEPTSNTTIARVAGQDRVDTALAIAKAAYKDSVSNVVIASSENYPDALSGSVLAHKVKAPILLAGSSEEDDKKLISYLKSNMKSDGTVYILGGTGSVSDGMIKKINEAGFKNVVRLGGSDRFETAAKIADAGEVEEGTPVIIVSGENYPDAMTVSSIAAVKQYPVLMVSKDEIPEAIVKEILKIKPGKIYIMGLQGALSTAVENKLEKISNIDETNVVRIGGSDRFETSLKAAKYFNLSGDEVCMASGNNFPDALAGSSYAANDTAPIILIGNNLTDDEKTYLQSLKLKEITIFEGTGVINPKEENEISKLVNK